MVVERFKFDGANSFTFMKHKQKGHTHEWCHHIMMFIMVLQWLLSTLIY